MNIPERYLDHLGPVAGELMIHWGNFLRERVNFNNPHSQIHAYNHCERVLYHALRIGEKIFGKDAREELSILAHAAIFHDTMRENDYCDVGHGWRSSLYYKMFCSENRPDISFFPESVYLMRYHDLMDSAGRDAICRTFPHEKERVMTLYAIFKDADALDRWRLGHRGLNAKFLRTDASKTLIEEARQLVRDTEDSIFLRELEKMVDHSLELQQKRSSSKTSSGNEL